MGLPGVACIMILLAMPQDLASQQSGQQRGPRPLVEQLGDTVSSYVVDDLSPRIRRAGATLV